MGAELSRLVKGEYDGISDSSIDEITRTVSAGLSATKRVFLIGDPGTGKTKFTGLIKQAFDKVLDNERLFVIPVEITDKTSETTLLGFVGIDGKWVDGILTQERGGRRLLRPIKAGTAAEPVDTRERDQVNLIILNEAKPQNLFPLKFISNLKRSNFENRTESVESRASERNGPFGE